MQGTSSSILDLIFLSDHFLNEKVSVNIFDGLSDHNIVVCTLSYPARFRQSGSTKRVYAFNKADDAAIMTYLAHEYLYFHNLCTEGSADIDEIWLQLKNHVLRCVRQFVPLIKKTTRKYNPWITREVLHLKRRIKCLRKSNKSSPVSD